MLMPWTPRYAVVLNKDSLSLSLALSLAISLMQFIFGLVPLFPLSLSQADLYIGPRDIPMNIHLTPVMNTHYITSSDRRRG